jgi:hypothetical protein
MKKTARIGILMVLLAFALTACATGGTNTPLPQTLNIEQPTSDTPKEIADYIGVWEGVWSSESGGYYYKNVLPVTIVIEQIKSSRVRAIYSWGNWDTYIKEGWKMMRGEIRNETITLKDNFGAITIEINSDLKTASATMRSSNFTATTTLHKRKNLEGLQIKARDISNLPEKIRNFDGAWQGAWHSGTPLYVEITVISEKEAEVMHSWEDNPSINTKAGSWIKKGGFDKNNVLTVVSPYGNIFTYEVDKNNNQLINASMEKSGSISNGILKKVPK